MKKDNKGYYAFISYKREDEKWAKWIQHRLESYKFPNEVRQRYTCTPQFLRPIFRDTTHLNGHSLLSSITDALKDSTYLIVICSPNVLNSVWVEREVDYFIKDGKEKFIIPVVVDGEPYANNPNFECLPKNLRTLSFEREILCINVAESGREGAIVRIASRMANIDFAELWQRHKREQKKKSIIKLALLSVLLIVALATSITFHHKNQKIATQNWHLMKSEAIISAEIAEQTAESGDRFQASILAASVLPRNLAKPNRPYSAQAERALRAAFATRGGMFKGHQLNTNVAILNKKSNILITGSDDNTIKIWNTSNGVCLNTLTGHKAPICNIELNKDENLLMSCDKEGLIKVWNLNTLNCISTININQTDKFNSIATTFDASGKHIKVLVKDSLYIYDSASGNCISATNFSDMSSESICQWISEDYLLTHTAIVGSYEIWNIENKQIIQTYNTRHEPILCADHQHLTVLDESGVLSIYSLKTGEIEKSIFIGSVVYSISPDLKSLIINRDNSIQIIDTDSGDTRLEMHCPYSYLYSIEWSSDMKSFIAISPYGIPIIWNIEANTLNPIVSNETKASMDILYSHNKQQIAYRIQDTIRVISADSHDILLELFDCRVWSSDFKFCPNDKYFLYVSQSPNSNNVLKIYNIDGKELTNTISIDEKIQSIAFNHDGTMLAIGTTAPLNITQITGKVYDSEYNLTTITLPTGDAYIYLWDFDKGQMLSRIEGHRGAVRSLKFTADNSLISCGNDGTIIIWNTDDYSQANILKGHTKPVSSILLTNDDSSIISGSWDGTIRIWDAISGECEHIIYAHDQHILDLTMSSTEKYLATSAVNEYKVFSLETLETLYTFENLNHISFLDDGNYLLASIDNSIYMHDVSSGECVMTYEDLGDSFDYDSHRRVIASAGQNGVYLLKIDDLQDLIDKTYEKYRDNGLAY